MDIYEYAVLVAEKIKAAAVRGDREEAVRLLRLLSTVATETADGIEGQVNKRSVSEKASE